MQSDASSQTARAFPPAVNVEGPTLQPAARWGDGVGDVTSAALSPDGKTVYFGVVGDAMRPDLLLDAAAPYLAVLFGVLGLLILVLGVRRVATRPQHSSKSYCRKCNYDLTPSSAPSSTPSVCPECGTSLATRPPKRGRRKARRLLPPVALAALCIVFTAALLIAPLWSGPTLRALGLGLVDPPPFVRRVLSPAVQKQSVGMSERLLSAPALGGTPTPLRTIIRMFAPLAIAPDGTSFFAGDIARGLFQYDARTGRRIQRAPMSDRVMVEVNTHSIIGFTPDGRGAYVQWSTRDMKPGVAMRISGTCGVSLWNLDTNTIQDVFSTVPWSEPPNNFPQPGPFWMQSSHPDWRFIQTPSFSQAYATKLWPVRAFTLEGKQDLASHPNIDPSGAPAFSREAGLVFTTANYGEKLVAISAKDGSIVGEITPQSRIGRFGDSLAFCELRQWLAVPDIRNTIFIRDIRAKKWIAALAFPTDCYAPRINFSDDGTTLAAVFQRNVPLNAPGTKVGGINATHDLIVWDLRQFTLQALPTPD